MVARRPSLWWVGFLLSGLAYPVFGEGLMPPPDGVFPTPTEIAQQVEGPTPPAPMVGAAEPLPVPVEQTKPIGPPPDLMPPDPKTEATP